MKTFKENEVGFAVGEFVFTYRTNKTPPSGNQIVTDLISYLTLTCPTFNDVDHYTYKDGTCIWLSNQKSTLNISNGNVSGKKAIHRAANQWWVDLHVDHKTKYNRVADLAEKLDLSIELRLEADVKPQIKLYQEMLNMIAPALKDGARVGIVVPASYLSSETAFSCTALIQTIGRLLRRVSAKNVSLHVLTEADIGIKEFDVDVILMNPPYCQ